MDVPFPPISELQRRARSLAKSHGSTQSKPRIVVVKPSRGSSGPIFPVFTAVTKNKLSLPAPLAAVLPALIGDSHVDSQSLLKQA